MGDAWQIREKNLAPGEGGGVSKFWQDVAGRRKEKAKAFTVIKKT